VDDRLSVTIGAFAAWIGFQFALWQDVSVSGLMAAATGFLFLLALLFSPSQGVVARFRQTRRSRQRFEIDLLLVHLLTHEGQRANTSESTLGHVSAALRWSPSQASTAIGRALNRGLIRQTADQLALTPSGRVTAELLGTR
jgi:manganese/zinc/iron transport system permease protein